MGVLQVLQRRHNRLQGAHAAAQRTLCASEVLRERALPQDTDYQAALEELDAKAHELVALSPEQALPVAVVWLKR